MSVIGGDDADVGAYPWMAAPVYGDYETLVGGQFCGACLIDSNWILTAGHCVDDMDIEEFLIAIGDANLDGLPRLIEPRLVINHPFGYHRTARGGDMALVLLSEPVDGIEPLKFRRSEDQDKLPNQGRIIGWGQTKRLGFSRNLKLGWEWI